MDNAPAGLKVGDKVKLSNGMNARVAKIDQVHKLKRLRIGMVVVLLRVEDETVGLESMGRWCYIASNNPHPPSTHTHTGEADRHHRRQPPLRRADPDGQTLHRSHRIPRIRSLRSCPVSRRLLLGAGAGVPADARGGGLRCRVHTGAERLPLVLGSLCWCVSFVCGCCVGKGGAWRWRVYRFEHACFSLSHTYTS